MSDTPQSSHAQTDAAWYEADQPKPISEVTMQEFDALCAKIAEQRVACDAKKAELSAENERLQKLEDRLTMALQEMGRTNYRSPAGTFSIVKKRTWALPKTPEERAAFFSYLKEQGVYETMVTVNSATFNSFVREQYETAESEGRTLEFKVPGVGEPSEYPTLRFLKGK